MDEGDNVMTQLIARFLRDEQGQDIIEYALIGSFVAFGAYLGADQLGKGYKAWFEAMDGAVDDAAATLP